LGSSVRRSRNAAVARSFATTARSRAFASRIPATCVRISRAAAVSAAFFAFALASASSRAASRASPPSTDIASVTLCVVSGLTLVVQFMCSLCRFYCTRRPQPMRTFRDTGRDSQLLGKARVHRSTVAGRARVRAP
jgi:hypothetical protein